MCVVLVQKPRFHWTWRPTDIRLSWYPLHSRGASQSESRQIHPGLDRLFNLYEWHWPEWRRVCPQEMPGIVMPLDNVNGRNARRLMATRKKGRAHQYLVFGVLKGSNGRVLRPSSRWVSRRKLSILYILSTPAFIQPSSLITALTSSRRGSRYSGLTRRRYKTCVTVYEHTMSRTASQGETEGHDLPETLYG
jgi:hypothetical protein